ncbi:peptidoglycan-binding domain-containing protein [Labrys okinawensis]|uniref:peptidoglycan-binding domain-containing protein n=1 Tax=Labrys okinawensis TaxID=346911 RepID=UPI0039BD2433
MREALARSDGDFTLSDKMEEAPSRYIGVMRVLLQRPMEVAGIAMMAGVGMVILVNALALQTGMRASPYIRAQERAGSVPVPPSAPNAAERGSADQATEDAVSVLRDVQLALAERGLYDGLADGVNGPKTTAAIRSFQQHNGLAVDGLSSSALLAKITASSGPVLTPDNTMADTPPAPPVDQIAALINGSTPAPAAGPQLDKRLLSVEKALANQGYGPLKVDGFMSKETRSAIGRFEKDHNLPVTGQVSERLIQALTRSGAKIE